MLVRRSARGFLVCLSMVSENVGGEVGFPEGHNPYG